MPNKTNLRSTRAGDRRDEHGFTLIEALVSIAVLGFGFVTTMAFHGELLGSAGENRLRSTAMSLAEAKLEALRAVPFDNLVAGSFDEPLNDIDAFGFFSLRPVSLTRCWVIEDETELKRVRVAVSRSGEACAPWADTALVTLTSRIANNDFARAGTKTLADARFNPDGLGDIAPISVTTGDRTGAPEIPGGFDVRDLDPAAEYGSGFALCDASSGTCLVPEVRDDGSQAFSTLSGNIFLPECTPGDGSVAQRCGIELVSEGNALCRLHFPGDSAVGSVPPALPVASDGLTLSYISYTCVIADQWRRSISVIPGDTEKVCVGNPALILEDGDPDDQLRTLTRFYDGRTPAAFDAEGNMIEENPYGLKGGPLTGDLTAQIGSVCSSSDTCWTDASIRGLVPGGHHFLVMPEAGGTCSARMEQLEVVDAESGTSYARLFARNPDIFHCTSSKNYFGDFCIGYTRASGFIQNNSSYDLTEDNLFVLGITELRQPCSFFGALGTDGGAYICGIRHSAEDASVQGVPLIQQTMFDTPDRYVFDGLDGTNYRPTDYPDYLPRDLPLDATARNFVIVDANVPPTAVFADPVCSELDCSFDASGSIDPDGSISSYSWNFGDSILFTEPVSNPFATHIYGAAGTYTVTLIVTDDEGAEGRVSRNITVTSATGNTAPTPSFRLVGCTELNCEFDASSSTDDVGIVSYTWDFGDGATGEGVNPTHTFAEAGTFTVTLTVTDAESASNTASQEITVNAPVVETRCTVTLSGQFQEGGYGNLAILSEGGTDSSCSLTGKNYSCSINVLDGATVAFSAKKGADEPYYEFVADCSGTRSYSKNF